MRCRCNCGLGRAFPVLAASLDTGTREGFSDLPHFSRYIGVDYSGAETADSSCKGIRVFVADGLRNR